ncbi:hypothetical protein [Flavobacterium sp. AG291]|uniref:hypothetical protein n=1 Tax=Flavobacterium sp. AG291 TaxID=2184000 RepID=UPI000E2BEB6A|nr:hypothetical protein [Flavobacterium sp. AG291]RDI08511.1 hypothetical protein DEU42_11042 [Flavobacterium sp. AG291]
MKKIALFALGFIAISCTENKQVNSIVSIQGQWKTLQKKVSAKAPSHNVGNCDGDNVKWKGDIYTFNADGSFSTKDICSGKPNNTQGNKWKYEDNVLTLEYMDKDNEMKEVYSVSDIGGDKIKWRMIYTRHDMNYMENTGYYLIMQKQ